MPKTNAFLPDLGSEAMTRRHGRCVEEPVGAERCRRRRSPSCSATTSKAPPRCGTARCRAWRRRRRAPRRALADRRFAAKEWAENPAAAYTAQMYLLNARTLMQMAEAVEGDAKTKARIRFAVQQWIDAMAPSNFLALNPEAQQLALEDPGPEPGRRACSSCWATPARAMCRRPTRSAFEVGRNVATTEGAVVFENELFQLIEYKPLGAKVHERPMLIVPPCINKFYIMDLQPENSLIRYTVEQGHRVFVVSWRNPDASLADKTWDDYIEHAAIRAIDVVQEITGAKTINTLGFCVGGTILATALAVLAARGQQPAQSVTLLTTLLDFSDTGVLDLFVDEAGVQLREMTLGDEGAGRPGAAEGPGTGHHLQLPAAERPGLELRGRQLPEGRDAAGLRPAVLERRRHQPARADVLLVPAPHLPAERTEAARQADGVRREARPGAASRRRCSSTRSREDHIVPWKAAYASHRAS